MAPSRIREFAVGARPRFRQRGVLRARAQRPRPGQTQDLARPPSGPGFTPNSHYISTTTVVAADPEGIAARRDRRDGNGHLRVYHACTTWLRGGSEAGARHLRSLLSLQPPHSETAKRVCKVRCSSNYLARTGAGAPRA